MNKVKEIFGNFKTHWNTPAAGRYIPYREIASYGVGGMGVYFSTALASQIGLSASNFLVGSCIGISPIHLQIMLTVANILGFAITAVREYLFDNVKSELGKFRPFLKWMGIPTVFVSILFVWMPYENMGYSTKIIVVEALYLLLNCFLPFYTEAFHTLLQVMSPDSNERVETMSIAQIIFSFAPTVTNLVVPYLAMFTGGLTDIRTYRIIYPVFSLLGVLLSFPVWKWTTERIIRPKSQENGIRFFDAIRSIVKNKYFWIINSATWVGFLESAYMVILGWTFVYGYPDKQQHLGLVQTIIGNGALWSMILTPFLIRKFGKRNLLIWSNIINIFLLAWLYPFFNNIWIVIIIFYLNNFVSVFSNIYTPGITADMKDYQQYITGERIDGMFGVVGLIGTVIGFFSGLVVPAIYEHSGLKTDYTVLFDSQLRTGLFKILIIASVVGAVCNVIPYLFYDLTEEKHKGIVDVLKIRAMFDDFSSGVLSDDTLIDAMKIIHTAKELSGKQKAVLSKSEIKLARKLKNKSKEDKAIRSDSLRHAKDEFYKKRDMNTDIELSPIILEELEKFSTQRYIKQIELAQKVSSYSHDTLVALSELVKAEIASMPRKEKTEKEIRSDSKKTLRIIKESIKLKKKYYPSELIDPGSSALENAQNMSDKTMIESLKKKLAVKRALRQISIYKRIVLPFELSEKLITSQKAYLCMDELEKRYNELCAQTVSEY